MSKNNIHCIVINVANEAKSINPNLVALLGPLDDSVLVDIISASHNHLSLLTKKLLQKNIRIVFIASYPNEPNEKTTEAYKNLLRRYSIDTILVDLSRVNSPLMRDLSGIEVASISLDDTHNRSIFIKNLLRYTQLKNDFRFCKRLLSITDKRNRWLANITQEPIAYIYKSTHIHANSAYLSLFDIQSIAELKSSSIWDLIPKENHRMFAKFIKKQGRHIDMQQALLMNMQTIGHRKIRAGVRLAPAVINKTQCLQVWVHRIEENITPEKNTQKSTPLVSPWESLPEGKAIHDQQTNRPTTYQNSSTLEEAKLKKKPAREAVTRSYYVKTFNRLRKPLKTVKLNIQPLTDTNTSKPIHYLAKIQFDTLEQRQVAKQLAQSSVIAPSTFWDHLLLIKLSRKLRSSHHPQEHQYLLSINADSLNNPTFLHFLIITLRKLPKEHSHIVFLLPQPFFVSQSARMIKLKHYLSPLNASLGIYHFTPDKTSLQSVLTHKPSYISFSSKWSEGLKGDSLENLSRLTRRLEQSGIQVILP